MSARKGWGFTLHNYTAENVQAFRDLYNPEDDGSIIVYICWGYEICPTTGTPHLQGYVHLSKRKRRNQVLELLPVHAHLTGANGTAKDNQKYCSKEDTKDPNAEVPFEEWGTCPGGPGTRNDLHEACAMAQAGKRLRDIVELYPVAVAKFHRGLTVVRGLRSRVPRPRPEVWVFWGEPGAGKTFGCRQQANDQFADDEIYSHRGGKWWQDYDGEKCVIFNDFTGGCISVTEWNRLIDTEPYALETKGGSAWAEFTKVLISSNYPPSLWWNVPVGRMRAALRRIDKCVFVGYGEGDKSYENAIWTTHNPAGVPQQAASYMLEIEPQPVFGPMQHFTHDAF